MKASELIGKVALRTRPAKTNYGLDGSYTDSTIRITDVTKDHIFYLSDCDYRGILNHYWMDENWVEYKEASHESPVDELLSGLNRLESMLTGHGLINH